MAAISGLFEDAVEDLQLGDGGAVAHVLLKPWFLGEDRRGHGLGYPTVAFAQQPDEVRARKVDFIEADGQDFTFGGLFLGDAHRKSISVKVTKTLSADAAQFRENLLHEQSRSRCMSRNVELMKTRTTRSGLVMGESVVDQLRSVGVCHLNPAEGAARGVQSN